MEKRRRKEEWGQTKRTGSGSLTPASCVARWPMRGWHAGEASCLGFDHGAEIVSAQGALLLEIVSDGHARTGVGRSGGGDLPSVPRGFEREA